MGARGPLPDSRRLQVLKSKAGRQWRDGRPLSNPPVAVAAQPPKPDDLGESGSWLWDLVAPELVRMGILGRLDVAELEAYCRVYERWKGTEPKARDWLPLIDRMSRLAQQLGCSPAARLRMQLPEPKAEAESAIFSG